MRWGLAAAVAAACSAGAAIIPASSAGERPRATASATIEAPQRFVSRGLSPELAGTSGGRLRVIIALRDPEHPGATANNFELAGRLSGPEIAQVTRGAPGAGHRVARRNERERGLALAELRPAARVVARAQRRLARAIDLLGGEVIEHDVAVNSVVAEVPRHALGPLGARGDVAAIQADRRERPLGGLATTTASVGAPSFWAAGFAGGNGASDSSPIDLAIISDKIQQDHPAFAGITFQTPSDQGTGTPCGSGAGSCDHGTAVASLAISRGATGCSNCVPDDASEKGVAPELDTVLDAAPVTSGVGPSAWALGFGGNIPGATDPAEVMSDSHGAVATQDDNIGLQNTDQRVSQYGATYAKPAGNSGPSQSVNEDCIAYNTLCMGAFRHLGTVDPTDDVVADFSSRGPTPAGRKKPDLVGIGVTMYAERRWWLSGFGLWAGSQEGTSFAAPQGAAAAALLAGSGISDPAAQKAILVNSARLGRATPASAMGTQTGWQPDWGWGALDLDAALGQRNFHTSTVEGGGTRFYRASLGGAGERATLVWHRRVVNCFQAGCYPQAMTLTNLNLQQLDPASGALQAESASSIDNVEQVRSAGGGDVIYKISAASTVDGMAGEPYALAARRPLTPLVTPKPTTDVTLSSAGPVKPGDVVTVEARVANPSPDLTAENVHVSLQLPAGVELVSGSPTQSFGTVTHASGQRVATWTVRAGTDGLKNVTATASASRYGATFETPDSATLTVDGIGPATTLVAPPARSHSTALPLSWGATDASGVRDYDIEVALNGGPFTPWISASTQTAATYTGSVGSRYLFRARATDTLGNKSAWVVSPEVHIVDAIPPGGPNPTPEPPPPTSPRLAIGQTSFSGRKLTVAGTLAGSATGRVTALFRARAGRRRLAVRGSAAVRHGRYRIRLRIPPRARTVRRGTLHVTYAGDGAFLPESRVARLRVTR